MKHTKKLLLLAFATVMSIWLCNAGTCTDEKVPNNYKPIVVRREITNLHRTLEAPIFAYYANGTITLEFVENLGTATVVTQNLTTGDQIIEFIDTNLSNVILEIESILTVGNYYMTITTISGDIYYAEFSLE